MKVPALVPFLFLFLASYRLWRLAAEDTILDRPRLWLVGLPRGWEEGDPVPDGYRLELAKFISCPWCLGFWISLGIWGFWLWQPLWTTGICAMLSISCAVGLVEHFHHRE